MEPANGIVADDDTDKALRRFFGRHLLCFSYVVQPIDKNGSDSAPPDVVFNSAFPIEIQGSWWLVTAGHCIDWLDRHVAAKKIRVESFRILDHYGAGGDRRHFVPFFEYPDCRRFYEFDLANGIDWGILEIHSFNVRTLQANGTVAVPKSEWSTQDALEYKGYFMLGIPKDSHNKSSAETPTGYLLSANPVPSVFYVERQSAAEASQATTFPRFIGSLSNSQGDIVGMSGGPIFGLLKNGEHRVVAIQSSWLSSTRTTFGFFVSTMARLAEQRIEQGNQ